MIISTHGILSSSNPLGIIDVDAQAFFDATGITDITQKIAVNNLTKTLKQNNLWAKFNSIYPYVGGAAFTHKFNLKNPALYQLSYSGGVTHSLLGMITNGSTGYANTGFVASDLIQDNTHISSYVQTSGVGCLMGAAISHRLYIIPKHAANNLQFNLNTSSAVAQTLSNNVGLWLASRISSTQEKLYSNQNLHLTQNFTSTGKDLANITIGGRNVGGGVDNYVNTTFSLTSIGQGFTDAESLIYYNAVQAFETTLGRQK
jgi:hypothetical protein